MAEKTEPWERLTWVYACMPHAPGLNQPWHSLNWCYQQGIQLETFCFF